MTDTKSTIQTTIPGAPPTTLTTPSIKHRAFSDLKVVESIPWGFINKNGNAVLVSSNKVKYNMVSYNKNNGGNLVVRQIDFDKNDEDDDDDNNSEMFVYQRTPEIVVQCGIYAFFVTMINHN